MLHLNHTKFDMIVEELGTAFWLVLGASLVELGLDSLRAYALDCILGRGLTLHNVLCIIIGWLWEIGELLR